MLFSTNVTHSMAVIGGILKKLKYMRVLIELNNHIVQKEVHLL